MSLPSTPRTSVLARVLGGALALSTPAAAVPTTISYSGFLTDNGVPKDGTVELIIELYDDRVSGSVLYSETYGSLVVPDGDLVVELGTVTPLNDSLLDEDELWVEITVDGTVLSPRARLTSVPYARRAAEADSLSGLTASDIQDQVAALQAQLASLQAQLTAAQGSLAALASSGGPSVAFTNVTGLSFSAPLQFSGGQATIAGNAITASHLATNSVAADEIAADAVGASEIATDAVGAAEIAANAVSTSEIATDGVGAAEIAAGAVGTSEIADGSISLADVRPDDLREVFRFPLGCTDDRLFIREPNGTCSTFSCDSFPCASPPCFANCNGICADASVPFTCSPISAGYLLGL